MLPKIQETKAAYAQLAHQGFDLDNMIATPRSQAQFEALIVDLKTKLKLQPEHSLIDVGCGQAKVLCNLAVFARRTMGLDLTPELLKVGRQVMPGGLLVCAEANKLPMRGGEFDRVLSYSTFMHFPNEAYAFKVIRELCRVCRPGGLVLIGDLPDRTLRRSVISCRWEFFYRLKVLLHRHPGPSIFNPLQWMFYDLSALSHFVQTLGYVAEILPQPVGLLCADHRADLLIRVHH